MASVTTNYGFDVPTSSDLVKNGATAISTLGQDIDTFLFRPFAVNPVLNSAFQVWQRGTSGAMGGTGTTYLADRWSMYSASAGTVSRQLTGDTTNLPNIQYCARVQRDSGQTANGSQIIGQSFETINSIPYVGKTVTFSFYARKGTNFSGASNVLTAYLRSGTGTDQNATGAGFTGSSFVITTSATLTSTWQRFTGTGTVSTSATQLETEFRYTTTGTAGAADYFEVTGVQLEIGSEATPFKTIGTYQQELAACQRYYFRLDRDGSGSAARVYPLGSAASASAAQVTIPFTVKMRTSPTAVSFSALRAFDGTNFVTLTNVVFADASTSYGNIEMQSSSGFTQYRPYWPANNGDGFIAFSAEL